MSIAWTAGQISDPASRWQPDGVHQASAVLRPARFVWSDATWTGVQRADLVFYELHVGTFTPAGTFDAIIPRLPVLRDLRVTALELMPIAQFPGTRNWVRWRPSLRPLQQLWWSAWPAAPRECVPRRGAVPLSGRGL